MAAPIILCDCAGMDEKRWLECREHGPDGDIEYTVGGNFKLSDNAYLFADVAKSAGGDIDLDWRANVGAKLFF